METLRLAGTALGTWDARRWTRAGAFAVVAALALGVPTVLVPNSFFGREIPPVWWNYPVWLLTSVLAGIVGATYWRGGASGSEPERDATDEERRTGRWGVAGSALAWFAVGCPVCNKFALLALGYSGALTWFAPVQPFLGLAGLVLVALAAAVRLRGEVACPVRIGSASSA